jgi:hypothetical protein
MAAATAVNYFPFFIMLRNFEVGNSTSLGMD